MLTYSYKVLPQIPSVKQFWTNFRQGASRTPFNRFSIQKLANTIDKVPLHFNLTHYLTTHIAVRS